jgi:hypothetical protein
MAELHRATDALSQAAGFAVPVFSALVFVDPASLTVKAPSGRDGTDLHVISERGLAPPPRGARLTSRRELSDEQLTTVMDAALRAETWHRSPQPSRPGTQSLPRATIVRWSRAQRSWRLDSTPSALSIPSTTSSTFSCSQKRRTRQPSRVSAAVVRASRSRFAVTLAAQKPLWATGAE